MADVCELLPWDTEFFGFRIARLVPTAPSLEEVEAALAWCRAESVRCLYFLCDADALPSARAAGGHGFALVDVRMTLERLVERGEARGEGRAGLVTRPAGERDLPALLELAGRSFRDSRFYADGSFPPARVDALYRRWVERDLRTRGRTVLLAERDGHLAGFVSGSIEAAGEGRVGLVAVHEAARGGGVGSTLLGGLLAFFRDHGAPRAVVVTQGRNTGAIRLYESQGFRTAAVQLWFHRWFDVRTR